MKSEFQFLIERLEKNLEKSPVLVAALRGFMCRLLGFSLEKESWVFKIHVGCIWGWKTGG
jgi:hypothetical protein